jgi:amidase
MICKTSSHALPDLYEASIAELQDGLVEGSFSSVQLVKVSSCFGGCLTQPLLELSQAYLRRIAEVNLEGPALHAIIETNLKALSQAAALDDERKVKGSRGPLHGIPLLLKDNIATLHEEGEIRCIALLCCQ